jgi:hypothetical protein
MIAFQFGGMALMALFFGALVTNDRREMSR